MTKQTGAPPTNLTILRHLHVFMVADTNWASKTWGRKTKSVPQVIFYSLVRVVILLLLSKCVYC